MAQAIRIGDAEYKQIKALAQKRGQFLEFVVNQAIRLYLKTQAPDESNEKSA